MEKNMHETLPYLGYNICQRESNYSRRRFSLNDFPMSYKILLRNQKKLKKSESLCIYDFFICFTRCWLRSTTPETMHTAWGTNKSNLNFWPDHRDLIWLAKVKPVGMSPVPGVLSWVVTVSAGCLFFFHHPELLVIYPTWIFHTRFLRRLSSPVCSVCWERCPTWLGQDGSSLRFWPFKRAPWL